MHRSIRWRRITEKRRRLKNSCCSSFVHTVWGWYWQSPWICLSQQWSEDSPVALSRTCHQHKEHNIIKEWPLTWLLDQDQLVQACVCSISLFCLLCDCSLPLFISFRPPSFILSLSLHPSPHISFLWEINKPRVRAQPSLPHIPRWYYRDRDINRTLCVAWKDFRRCDMKRQRHVDWWWLVEGRSHVWVAPLLFLRLRWDGLAVAG